MTAANCEGDGEGVEMETIDTTTSDGIAARGVDKGEGTQEEFEKEDKMMADSTLLPSSTPDEDSSKSDSKEELEDGSEETGVKAGLIVASMFFLHLIDVGIKISCGLYIGELVYQLDTSIDTLGFVLGFSSSCDEILAPFIAPMTKHTPIVMPAMLIGSFVMATCVSLTSMSPSILWFATAEIIAGVAFAFVRTLSRIVFSEHFTKHFAFVSGISDLGYSVGVLVPLVTERLLDIYGWRGLTLILGGINFNFLILCYAMPVNRRRRRDRAKQDGNSELEDGCTSSKHAVTQTGNDFDDADEMLLSKHSETSCDAANVDLTSEKKETAVAISQTEAGDDETLEQNPVPTVIKSKNVKDKILAVFRWMWKVLDWSICREEPYLNFALVATFIFCLVATAFYIFIIPHALAKGITLSQAVLLTVITGVGDMVGTFGQGIILDKGWMTSSGLFMLLGLLNSVMLMVDPLIKGFVWATTCSFFIGVLFGGQITLTFIIFKEITPPSRFATSYGLSAITSGLAGPIGGFLSGWIASELGYEMMFLVFGGIGILSVVALFPSYLHYDRRKKEVPQEELR